jgi:hypothetical protein
MWRAEDRCTCQSRCVLRSWDSNGCTACICRSSEWNGTKVLQIFPLHFDNVAVFSVFFNDTVGATSTTA